MILTNGSRGLLSFAYSLLGLARTCAMPRKSERDGKLDFTKLNFPGKLRPEAGRGAQMDLARLPVRTQLTIVLLVVTVLISAVAALNTSNYQQFFPALEQLQVSIISIHANPSSQSLNGSVTFAIENPTGYSGLAMKDLLTNFTVTFPNMTIPQGSILYGGSLKRLNPNSPIDITLELVGSGTGPDQVTKLIKNGAIPQYAFTINLILTTFLDQVLGMTIPYQCPSTTTPVACEQVGIIVTSNGGGPSGGGGR